MDDIHAVPPGSSNNYLLTHLYGNVKFSVGFKVKDIDGTVLQRAYTALPMVWDTAKAGEQINKTRTYAYQKLKELHGDKFSRLMGRELLPSDLSVGFAPADELLSSVYIDDVNGSVPGHLMIETSPDNYHAHFKLDRPCTEVEAAACLRALKDWYGGDPGAMKPRQVRRFVTEGLSFKTNWDEESVSVDYCVKNYPPIKVIPLGVSDTEADVDLTDAEKSFFADVWARKFRRAGNDASIADFGLATYLIENGQSAEKVSEAIRFCRKTLDTDKNWYEGHGDDYLRNTVEKAAAVISAKPKLKKGLSL